LNYQDPYDLIGTGHFSKVYIGCIMNGEDKTKVAVKIPNIEKPEDIEALQNELKTLSRTELHHENVCQMLMYINIKGNSS